jgi:tetratricopeptide (TPR) repeat protein
MNGTGRMRVASGLIVAFAACGAIDPGWGDDALLPNVGSGAVPVKASLRSDASVLGGGNAGPRKADADMLGKQGMQRAVSTMLITEADFLKTAQEEDQLAQPSVPKASSLLEKMYEAMDDVLDEEYEMAIPKLETVLKAEPTLHAVWSTLGWAYWEVGRREDALALWRRLLALNPDHPLPHTQLGNGYAGMGQLGLAEKHLRRAVELDPQAVQPRLLLGAIYRWSGRYEESIRLLGQLVREDADRLDVKTELAMSLFQHGNYEEALPYLREARRWNPDDADLVVAEARALLHTGRIDEAVAHAERVLQADEANIEVLMLLADAPRYKNSPAESIPYLERILRTNPNDQVKRQVSRRLVETYTRLWETDPTEYPLRRPIELAHDLVKMDPDFAEWQMTLAELQLMDQAFAPANRRIENVLKEMNPNCYRAHVGLFEVNQATKRYGKALEQFDKLRAFNSADPYLENRLARLELSRGDFAKAYRAVDRLEAGGARGAVAVLVYRELSASDWTDLLSVRRFRLHLLALKQAGYVFVTPDEIGRYFADKPPLPRDIADYSPERVVCVTFDGASARTLALATEVANDLDLVFAMHLPVGRIERGDPLVATWDELNRYRATGRWAFGSLLLNADRLAPIAETKMMGSVLGNRIWDETRGTLETEAAYLRRIRDEYKASRAAIRTHLGADCKANFVAYPFGDFGQGPRSNVPNAIEVNLNEAAVNYEIGFVDSEFGHAVSGDNPLLYQRHAPGIADSGQDVVEKLMGSHPVFLARRLRAETAALHGRLYRAMDTLDTLARDGYPPRLQARTEAYVYDRMSGKLGVSANIGKVNRSAFDLTFDNPYIGGRFGYFRDSLDRRNWDTRFMAGVNVTDPLLLEAYGGFGELRQQYTIMSPNQDPDPDLELDRISLRVDERHVGARFGYRIEPEAVDRSSIRLGGYITRREFRKDVERDDWAYGGELAWKPWLSLDLTFAYDHDLEPSARALVRRVRYDLFAFNAVLRIRDWWDVIGALWYYDYTDANERAHWVATSMWELSEEAGLLLGLRYAYSHASRRKNDYWTPYKLHQFLAILGLRHNWHEFYYDVKFMSGIGKEGLRKEDEDDYNALVIQAREQQFDPGRAPERDWEWIIGAEVALRYYFRRHFDAFTTFSYNETPSYDEIRSTTGVRLIF